MGPDLPFIDPPDRGPRLPWLKLIRTPKDKPISIIILSSQIIGVRVHRVDKHPFMCPKTNCPVPGCPNAGRYQGYAEVMSPESGNRAMFEFTSESTHTIECMQVENGLTCRGFHLILEREGHRTKAPINITLTNIIRRTGDLPEGRDMRPFIMRLYKRR